jgi:RHS repeat-associated protein
VNTWPNHCEYDAENRLTRVIWIFEDAVLATYKYDALGRRIEFIDHFGAVTKRYLYDADQVIEEYDGAGTPARQRYYVWGNYVDELLMMYRDSDASKYFVCHNQIYSPEALLSSTGSIVERYDYDAYGKPLIYTDAGTDGTWFTSDDTNSVTSAKGLVYFFTGRELDHVDVMLHLYNYRARNYDPLYGRFLQRDPAGYIDGMNLYQYVRSTPVMRGDPNGMMSFEAVELLAARNLMTAVVIEASLQSESAFTYALAANDYFSKRLNDYVYFERPNFMDETEQINIYALWRGHRRDWLRLLPPDWGPGIALKAAGTIYANLSLLLDLTHMLNNIERWQLWIISLMAGYDGFNSEFVPPNESPPFDPRYP